MSEADMRDVWVRQVLGNQGNVSAAEAATATQKIVENTSSGLLPTTGGAMSLMFRPHVDALYQNNRGLFAKFRPAVPDNNGKPAKSLSDWYVATFEQALFHGMTGDGKKTGRPFHEGEVEAMDGVLITYDGCDVDWRRIHAYATTLDPSVEPYGQGRNWLSDGSGPLSVLAFCGSTTRAIADRYR